MTTNGSNHSQKTLLLEQASPASNQAHVGALHFREAYAGDIVRVEESMAASLTEDHPFVGQVLNYLTDVGGKRLRPILALAAAEACRGGRDRPEEEAVQAAAIVELVHVGTLYHDDVIDEAETRRGVLSANRRWGNTVAVLAGDYLIARASEVAASLGGGIAERLSTTIADMCRGQLLESAYERNPARSPEVYLSAISGKTAALMAASCWLAPLAASRHPEDAELMRSYGHSFGMIYQIVDDILDIFATEEQLGKPVGSDIRAGIYNLPVILAIEEDPGVVPLLRADWSPDLQLEIKERIDATSAVERCNQKSDEYLRHAMTSLDGLSSLHSDTRNALEQLTTDLAKRTESLGQR